MEAKALIRAPAGKTVKFKKSKTTIKSPTKQNSKSKKAKAMAKGPTRESSESKKPKGEETMDESSAELRVRMYWYRRIHMRPKPSPLRQVMNASELPDPIVEGASFQQANNAHEVLRLAINVSPTQVSNASDRSRPTIKQDEETEAKLPELETSSPKPQSKPQPKLSPWSSYKSRWKKPVDWALLIKYRGIYLRQRLTCLVDPSIGTKKTRRNTREPEKHRVAQTAS